jgi:quercetin dioxygenase-like cupin family protein
LLVHAWKPDFGHTQHYHPRADEIWYILEGQLKVSFDDDEPIIASPGSILFAKKGTRHAMTSIGEKSLIMLVIVTPNETDDEVSSSP